MRVHFVIHESFEAPGAFQGWAEKSGYDTSFTRLYDGDQLPANATGIDALIVMGGPQSPATTTQECPHFDSEAEQIFIRQCIEAGCAVVGVCLGAQLIGQALGAPYDHSPEKEIGCFPITFTQAGRTHPVFNHCGGETVVGHWHNDMPGLTAQSVVLATSEGCPRQIVQYTPLVYGLQCHLEFTPEVIEGLIEHSHAELAAAGAHRFVQQPNVLRAHDYFDMNALLMRFLDNLVEQRNQSCNTQPQN